MPLETFNTNVYSHKTVRKRRHFILPLPSDLKVINEISLTLQKTKRPQL